MLLKSTVIKKFNAFWPDTIIILIISLLPLLFFWRLIAPKIEDQQRIVAGDFTEQYFPLRAFTATEWATGRVPLWNPALFGGQPALADIQSGALYPPHVLQGVVLGWLGYGFPLTALEWQVIMHFSIAGVGAYLLGRYWGRQCGAKLKSARFMGGVVALVFTYGGYLTGFPVQQLAILQSAVWLPWLMWLLSCTLDAILAHQPLSVSLSRAAWAALPLALSILAGHPQTVLYLVYLSFAYTLFITIAHRTSHSMSHIPRPTSHVPRSTSHFLLLSHYVLIIILGVMLAAAQLLPTLEFIKYSLRADLSFEAVSAGLPLSELMAVVYPGYFGGSPQYVGIFSLVLVGVAVVLAPVSKRWLMLFWVGVALVTMVVAFGANTFLYPLLYLITPGFAAVRQQERIFLVYTFALATLSGYGVLWLTLPMSRLKRVTWAKFQTNLHRFSGVALLLSVLFIYGAVRANQRGDAVNLFNGVLRHHSFGLIILGGGLLLLALRPKRIWRRWWGMALVWGWIGFNLFTVNWQFNLESRSFSTPFMEEGVSQFLIERQGSKAQPIRVASGGLLKGGNNAASVHHLEDVTGNTPLQLANVALFADKIPAWRFWQLMNVLYVVDERDITGPGLSLRYEADGVKVFEVGDPFPRARLVYKTVIGDDILMLAEETMDLKTTALLPTAVSLSVVASEQVGQVTVNEAVPGRLVVTVNTPTNGLLVLSNIDYLGWQARLDDAPTDIYRTNGIFQGVFVHAGEHEVVLSFKPLSFRWGVVISGLGLVLVVGLILIKHVYIFPMQQHY